MLSRFAQPEEEEDEDYVYLGPRGDEKFDYSVSSNTNIFNRVLRAPKTSLKNPPSNVVYNGLEFEYVPCVYSHYKEAGVYWGTSAEKSLVNDHEKEMELWGEPDFYIKRRPDDNGINYHKYSREGPAIVTYDITDQEAVEIDSDEWEEEAANLQPDEEDFLWTEDDTHWIYQHTERVTMMTKDTPDYNQFHDKIVEYLNDDKASLRSTVIKGRDYFNDITLYPTKDYVQYKKEEMAREKRKKNLAEKKKAQDMQEAPKPAVLPAEKSLVMYSMPSYKGLLPSYPEFITIRIRTDEYLHITSCIGYFLTLKGFEFTVKDIYPLVLQLASVAEKMTGTVYSLPMLEGPKAVQAEPSEARDIIPSATLVAEAGDAIPSATAASVEGDSSIAQAKPAEAGDISASAGLKQLEENSANKVLKKKKVRRARNPAVAYPDEKIEVCEEQNNAPQKTEAAVVNQTKKSVKKASKKIKRSPKKGAKQTQFDQIDMPTADCNEIPVDKKSGNKLLKSVKKRIGRFGRALRRLVICGMQGMDMS